MRVIDSHTEGEPTRVIVEGGPDLGGGPLAERRAPLRRASSTTSAASPSTSRAGTTRWWAHSSASRTIPSCAAGVIFFNNVGYLGMCGHGTIGLAVTLAHMGAAHDRAPSLRDAGRKSSASN